MNKKSNSFTPFLLAGIWATFILVLSTVGIGLNLPETWDSIIGWDKLAHAFVYFVLVYFLFKGFSSQQSKLKSNIYTFLISTGYGILMEIVQYSFFPNRYFEILDIIANIVGTIAGLLFIYFLTTKNSQ